MGAPRRRRTRPRLPAPPPLRPAGHRAHRFRADLKSLQFVCPVLAAARRLPVWTCPSPTGRGISSPRVLLSAPRDEAAPAGGSMDGLQGISSDAAGVGAAIPPRPATKLPTLAFLRAVATNSLSALDEELFDELIVARRYLGQRVFFVSDPDGIKRVFLDNFDNYPRYRYIRRLFQAGLGTGSLGTEGELWWRHRRIAAPAIDHRAIMPDIA